MAISINAFTAAAGKFTHLSFGIVANFFNIVPNIGDFDNNVRLSGLLFNI